MEMNTYRKEGLRHFTQISKLSEKDCRNIRASY